MINIPLVNRYHSRVKLWCNINGEEYIEDPGNENVSLLTKSTVDALALKA